jgi:hypothetical protein
MVATAAAVAAVVKAAVAASAAPGARGSSADPFLTDRRALPRACAMLPSALSGP